MKCFRSKKLTLFSCILNYFLAVAYFIVGDPAFFIISLSFGVLCHRNYLSYGNDE